MPRKVLRTNILNPNVAVGQKVKEARKQSKLTQLQVAESANKILVDIGAIALPLHSSELARLELGERGLKYLEAWAIAQVLGVETDDFLPNT